MRLATLSPPVYTPVTPQNQDQLLPAWLSSTTALPDPFPYMLPSGAILHLTHVQRKFDRQNAINHPGFVLIPASVSSLDKLVAYLPGAAISGGAALATPTPIVTPPVAPIVSVPPIATPAGGATTPALVPATVGGGSLFTLDQIKAFIASPTGRLVAYAAGGLFLLKLLRS